MDHDYAAREIVVDNITLNVHELMGYVLYPSSDEEEAGPAPAPRRSTG